MLRLPHGSLDLEKAEHNYNPEMVPEKGYFYMPVQCQQCKNPPCVKVCPVHATWQETDGITVIDYDWCIGCRYCEAACPYWARRFNFTKPSIPKERLNPDMAYLGNRPRRQGVMEKCHFCIQRTRAGRYPACLEVCPAGARKFGNILDPESEVSYILRTKRVFIQLKEEIGHFAPVLLLLRRMRQAVRNYLVFLWRCGRLAFVGDWRYYTWMGVLTVICLLGLNAYARQFAHGLIVTGMSDEVSWGVYIANFTFLVGVAAAAVMMVIPVYIYNNEELHDLVIFGELLAVAAILMCLAFVTVDLGRPDRFWHLIPGIGQFNFPASMLSWDVIVLNGYLLLNVHICGYLLYCRYQWPDAGQVVLHSVCLHRHRLGGFDPHRHRLPLRRPGRPAVLELGDRRAALPRLGIHGRAGADHPGDAGGPPRHGLRSRRRRLAVARGVGRRATAEEPRRRPSSDLDLLARHLPELASVPKEVRQSILAGAMVLEAKAGDVLLRQGETEKRSLLCPEGPGGRQARGKWALPDHAQPRAGRTVRRDLRPGRNAAHGHGHCRRARPGPEPAGRLPAQADDAPRR